MDIQELMNRVAQNLSVGRAFGPAYDANGTLVIPVALVAGGGGGGEATTTSSSVAHAYERTEQSGEGGPSTGSGGGFGGVVLPVGAYVVEGQKVRWVPAVNATVVILAGLSVIRLLAHSRRRARRRRA